MTMIKAILELLEQHAAVPTFLVKEMSPAKYPGALLGSAGPQVDLLRKEIP